MTFATASVNYNPPASTSYTPFLSGVSSNGRYLVDQRGNPFLMNADTAWNLAWGADLTDQTTYISDRASNGFNTILTDLVGNSNMSGNANGNNWNGEPPFGSGFSLSTTYWSRIDSFLNLCQQYGISCLLLPADAYATESGETFFSMTNTQATTYMTTLSNRWPAASYPGIVWMFGNDYAADGTGTGCCIQGFTTQYQAMINALAANGDTRPWTIELGFYETLSSDGASLGPQAPLNWGYTYHVTYEMVIRGYGAKDIPVFHGEGSYENTTGGYPANPIDIRKQTLWTMTSGGCGEFYGNDALWELGAGWQTQLDTTMVAQRKAHMAVIAEYDWWKLQPDTSSLVVTGGRNTQWPASSEPAAVGSTSPSTADSTYGWYVTASYASDGTLAMIYNPGLAGGGATTMTLSSAHLGSSPQITRVDPTNGAKTNIGWTTSVASPGNNAGGDPDWLYIITAA